MQFWFTKDALLNSSVLSLVKKTLPREVCFLATNQERYRARFFMESLEFNRIFVDIFAAWQLGFAKPHANFYLQISEQLQERFRDASELEIYFVDDMEKNVAAAAALGWNSHQFQAYSAFESWLKDCV